MSGSERLIGLPTGLGGIIFLQAHLSAVKDRYTRLRLGFAPDTLRCRPLEYLPFLVEFARTIFVGEPYEVEPDLRCPLTTPADMINEFGIEPRRPRLASELCRGLDPGYPRPYLVLHTKARLLHHNEYVAVREALFEELTKLSGRYAIVALGERVVERNAEYQELGENSVYSIYEDAKSRLQLVDATFPAIGVTPPDLSRLRQDCLVMREAKASIHLGLGGGLCLAAAVGNVLCLRSHYPFYFDRVFTKGRYPGSLVTEDWSEFREALREL